MFTIVVTEANQFDYSYYLNKNAPLPDNWKQRKADYKTFVKHDILKQAVFRELFEECNSPNQEVAGFVLDFISKVFPVNFL